MLKARIKFRKYGVMKFIGHLDLMRFFQKAMRRAEIPIAFTEGYSPHMIMSFAQPLGLGVTSDGEYLDIELTESISSQKAVEQLNSAMVEGIEVLSFLQIPDDRKQSGMTIVSAADYRVTLLESCKTEEVTLKIPEHWKAKADAFLSQPHITVWKKTKKSEKEVDIRQMIYEMRAEERDIYLCLAAGSEQNLKPDLVMEAFLTFMGEDAAKIHLHYHRLEIYTHRESFVPLDTLGQIIR